MGYVVKYNEDMHKNLYVHRKSKILKYIFPIILLLLFVGVMPLRKWLYNSFVPANFNLASKGFTQMIQNIEQGDTITNAVAVFCQELILNE